MNLLVQKGLVRGLPNKEFTKDGLCDSCQKGKQRIAYFKSKSFSSIDEPLMLLHMDLFGPVDIISISKNKYALVIVYDFTRFTWKFFLHSKDEASQLIINHIKNVETGSKWKVATIRSDNGTEFKNSSMREFCESKGISQTFSASRTPQQNGVVERKNKTLIEAARTMLEDSKLPTYFWAKAINTACFTQYISIINHAQDKTAYQLMKEKKPTLGFLHVFGCKCFVLRNQGENLGKFEAKDDEAIFFGYAIAGKAYRVYNLRLNIVMESVHVVFDDKKITGFLDNGNQELLHFENEVNTDQDDSEDENVVIKKKQIAVDVIPPTDNLSGDHLVSTDNVSTANPSTYIQNFGSI